MPNLEPIYVPSGSGATPRPVKDRLGEIVYAKDFGAVGNGVADDTSAIQAAINSLTSTGGIFKFGHGTFKTTAPLTYPSANIIIDGGCAEQAAILKPTGNVAAGIIFGDSVGALGSSRYERLQLRNLKIDGTNCTATGGVGVKLRKATRWVMSNVWCIQFDGATGAGFWFADEVWIGGMYDCRTQDNTIGVWLKPTNRDSQVGNGINIIGGEYGQGEDHAIVIGDKSASSNQSPSLGYLINIRDALIEGTSNRAVWVAEGDTVNISGCGFEANDVAEITLGTSGGAFPRSVNIRGCYMAKFSSADMIGVDIHEASAVMIDEMLFDYGGGGSKTGIKIQATAAGSDEAYHFGPRLAFGAGVTTKFDLATGSRAYVERQEDAGYNYSSRAYGKRKWHNSESGSRIVHEQLNLAGDVVSQLGEGLGLYPATGFTGNVINVTAVAGGSGGTSLFAVDHLGGVAIGTTNFCINSATGRVIIGGAASAAAQKFHVIGRCQFENSNHIFFRDINTGNSTLDLEVQFDNSNGVQTNYTAFRSVIRTNTAGGENGEIDLRVAKAGAITDILVLGGSTFDITIADTADIILSTGTGTKIGTATGQKLAFWGSDPVVQPVLATGGGANVDNVISLLQTLGLCKQS